jgi:uncharacterized protein with beta-barrel porin domain
MTIRNIRPRLLVSTTLVAGLGLFSSAAQADCVADASASTVSCTSTSTGFSTSSANVAISVASGASVTGTGLQAVGAHTSIDNLGTINTGSGTTAILVGGNSTITQEAAATGAITGNITFGAALAGQVNTLNNLNLTSGIAGEITTVGNTVINNAGLLSGDITETNAGVVGSVSVSNLTGATITGAISTVDATTVSNSGTISGSIVTTGPLSVTNNAGATLTGTITDTTLATGAGNLLVVNNGTLAGAITEAAGGTPGTVTITNGAAGILTGDITTADATTFTNAGTYSGVITTPASATSTVNNNGIMTTSGTLTGSLTNSGTLTVGTTATPSAPALLTINGNYAQTAGTLNVAIVSSAVAGTGFSQIHTTGTASLAGTITVAPVQGFYPSGSTYNVVLADQGITNNGVTVSGATVVSPFLTFASNGVVTVAGTQQALQIQATRTGTYASVLAATANANQLAVAGGAGTASSGGFQALVNTANATPLGDAAVLVGGVDFMTVAQAQTFFDQISPEGYGAYVTALQDQGNLFTRQVSLRLDTVGITKDAAGLWLTPYYQRGKSGGEAYGSGQNIFGVQGGYDVGTEKARGGVSFGYSSASVDYNVGNMTGTDNSLQLGVYGGVTLKRLNADLQVAYIHGSISTSKTIDLGDVTRTATASTHGNLFKAVGTLAYNFGGPSNKIQPFVGVDISKGKIRGFTEAGATTADLTVDSLNADRRDLLVGLDYARMTGSIRPYAHIAYRYDIANPNTQINALFNADPTTSFTVTDLVPSRSEEDANIGVRFQADEWGSYMFVGYQGTIRSGLTSHGVNAGIMVAF